MPQVSRNVISCRINFVDCRDMTVETEESMLRDEDDSLESPEIDDELPETAAAASDEAPPEPRVVRHRIRKRLLGRRLDKYLHGRYPRISRTILQRYIKQGLVTVNDMPTKASYEPAAGDIVQLTLPPPPPSEVEPQDIPIDIIYEDEWMLALNKATNMVCHPAYPGQTGTVANAVAFHAEKLSRGDDPFRPGIMHRLDKNTTGVLLIAKTDEAHWRISLQFERRTVRKEYFAICEGKVRLDGDIINKPLAPHPETTQRMVLAGAAMPRESMFKEAITEYRVDKRFRGFTSVNLFPKTGRTHQLRIHMSSIGHPIVGDAIYGGHHITEFDLSGNGDRTPLITHQALHARRIRIIHPIHETPLEVEAPLPPHITRILELLEAHRNS